MNERIRELAEQAWDTPIDEMGDVVSEDGQYSWDFHRATEKFAELIVRECASIIESQDVDPAFKHRIGWAMKKHFGVE